MIVLKKREILNYDVKLFTKGCKTEVEKSSPKILTLKILFKSVSIDLACLKIMSLSFLPFIFEILPPSISIYCPLNLLILFNFFLIVSSNYIREKKINFIDCVAEFLMINESCFSLIHKHK